MENLEYYQYEARPYAYALIAAACFYNRSHSKLLFFAAVTLAVCSYVVFKARREYRARNRLRRRIH